MGIHKRRVDANQGALNKLARAMGCSVWVTSDCGEGAPDAVWGIHGVNLMIEIKDGAKPPSRRLLTHSEIDFHAKWKGQIAIVSTIEEAAALINSIVPRIV